MSESKGKYRLAITNALMIQPGEPENPVTADLLVAQDGTIAYIGSETKDKIENADRVIDATGKWLLPGFVSAHSHLWQHGLASRAPNSNVAEWSTVVGNSMRRVRPCDMYMVTFNGALGHVRKGITTAFNSTCCLAFRDGRAERAQFEAVLDAGIRFVHGFSIGHVTKRWSEARAIARTELFRSWCSTFDVPDHFFGSRMVLQGLEYDEKRTLATEAMIKKRFSLDGYISYLESPDSNHIAVGKAGWAWLKEFELVHQEMTIGHFLHTSTAPEIVQEAAKAGMRMTWNPLSNGRLGSGVLDLPKDIPIALGVDGEAASGRCDPFENMRMGLYSVRQSKQSAGALAPHEIYFMHTLGAAQVLNIADRVGSLETGKLADMILLKPPHTREIRDHVSALVFASGVEDIEVVFIGGLEEWPRSRPMPTMAHGGRWKPWNIKLEHTSKSTQKPQSDDSKSNPDRVGK
ncbi:Amidohydrolase 1 [Penicillium argentinense]|uniref:Amidohydrolase 1 n=1 Tax=Penicillium argentinense TaxID=1131581 RepID=A0A9W9EWB0_9EURO|nr:Amidohydrolase 1 [Penicillium argentinense]KAJ5089202.1 Amidohydrolase 1 [Penicillium argentinense]